MFNVQKKAFSTTEEEPTPTNVSPKLLCQIAGTKYYPHNEEIDLPYDSEVRLFDENDTHLGIVSLAEAREKAQDTDADLVMRNAKMKPPILKVMNYRKELLKKLFQKFGKGKKDIDMTKFKTIKLATTISVHDLENKKRQAVNYLKQIPVLKFYMRVNKYDPENVQKGKIMLLNLAEELKSYAKVKISPSKEEKAKSDKMKEQFERDDSKNIDDFKTLEERALEQEKLKDEILDSEEEETEGQEHLYMELESTVCFGDIDIDQMMQTSSYNELIQELYQNAVAPGTLTKDKKDTKEQKSVSTESELDFGDDIEKVQERLKMKSRLKMRIFDEDKDGRKKDEETEDLLAQLAEAGLDQADDDMGGFDNESTLLESMTEKDWDKLDLETYKRLQAAKYEYDQRKLFFQTKEYLKNFKYDFGGEEE